MMRLIPQYGGEPGQEVRSNLAAVIIGIDDEACFLEYSDELEVSSAVLAEAMSDLEYGAHRPPALPPAARDS